MKCISGPSLWSYHPEPSISGRSPQSNSGASAKLLVGGGGGRSRQEQDSEAGQGHRSKLTLWWVREWALLVQAELSHGLFSSFFFGFKSIPETAFPKEALAAWVGRRVLSSPSPKASWS